jgi:hypothetical protein
LQFAISTIGNSAGLIGADYVIVNELALTRAGYGRTPIPAGLADCAEKESTVIPRPFRSTRSLAMGKIIAVAAGQELMAL